METDILKERFAHGSQGLLDEAVWEHKTFLGRWLPSEQAITVREPATGEVLGLVGKASVEEVREATARARAAQPGCGETSPDERAHVLRTAAGLLERDRASVAEWLIRETGCIAGKAQTEIAGTIGELYHSAALLIEPPGHLLHSADPDRLSFTRRVPVGVVGVITPWNFPLLLAMRSVAPALALGNAVVLKPDVQTAVTGGVLIARMFEEAGLPPEVLHVVNGGAEIGEALIAAREVRLVTFTGSTAVGRRVGELAGLNLKKVSLELGGKSPLIVLDDADIPAAASAGAWGSFLHQGQICMATGRHIVDRRVYDQYFACLVEKANALPTGDPFRAQVAIGPIINEKQRNRIHDIVTRSQSQGAQLLAGGTYEGPFYRPTVLGGVTRDMPAYIDEIFGPVASVIVAEDEEHAIELANDTEYGLSGAVQTGSLERGLRVARRIRAGMVHVNDQTIADLPGIPMGGMGQSGNGSRFGSTTNWDEFTEWQWMTIGGNPARYPF